MNKEPSGKFREYAAFRKEYLAEHPFDRKLLRAVTFASTFLIAAALTSAAKEQFSGDEEPRPQPKVEATPSPETVSQPTILKPGDSMANMPFFTHVYGKDETFTAKANPGSSEADVALIYSRAVEMTDPNPDDQILSMYLLSSYDNQFYLNAIIFDSSTRIVQEIVRNPDKEPLQAGLLERSVSNDKSLDYFASVKIEGGLATFRFDGTAPFDGALTTTASPNTTFA
jgi:hypothetical protein